ncbi:glycoside hydrolase family 43 protein [Luteolibacter sp. GHJ8]|uniref:Glycoside hydrolase family 43 protein n=1 Tax=Luteolibacter rhizosphaerae TaxID=2989719 RepID=A0ABT3G5Q1_9BACT|nr:glycoside hydrolase family 43 protein [Luteolibacter rhizosphaerae]MCW1915163.1 glycoside hydrolase family 43 protein [Luteolibacter rhizosphaerae]
MKRQYFLLCGLVPALAAVTPASGEDGAWVMAYFRQRYEGRVEIDAQGKEHQVPLPDPMAVERLHLAISEDGSTWKPLNENKPVWEQRLRDPFVKKGKDGLWHLMGTGGGRQRKAEDGPVCLHAVSKDLLKWDLVEALPLMKGVKDEQGRPARNIWAPEWFADERSGETVLIWSSSFEDAGWKKSRLWYSRTKDWKEFSPAKVLFTPPYSVIDGNLLEKDGKYYLFHKEEEFSRETGERRAIRVAVADALEGPYTIHEGPLNKGQIVPVITEGPSIMPDPKGKGWLLLYDYCMTNRFGLSASDNLFDWKVEESASFPADARHGSALRVTAEEQEGLKKAFPEGSVSGD